MKPGDLVQVNFLTPYGEPSPRIGILLQVHEVTSRKSSWAEMLCSSGELKRFLLGTPESVEVISETR